MIQCRKTGLWAAIVLLLSLAIAGSAWGYYPPDGTKPDGMGGYMIPADGMCVVGIKLDGTLLVDWSITTSRDCVAWTKSADGTVDLVSMDTQDKCTKAGASGNDGYKHAWSTSLCYDVANGKGISRVDLDNTDSMCFSKGGTVVTTGKCVAYGWQYRNRKADNTLPVSGTDLGTTDGVQFTDGLGFCATQMRMTSATFNSSATCPSLHNSASTAPAGEWTPFGPGCLSSTSGCQSQASYDAGLGWSSSGSGASYQCLYTYGVKGVIHSDATKADGTKYLAGSTQDLTVYTNQGDCLANGFSWDNWLPNTGTSTKDNTSGGEYAGMPDGAVIRRLDALSSIEDGGGDFYSGTGAVCEKCHSDQSRSYQERNKPGFPLTRHKLAGDAIGKPFQPNFTEAGSDWGLQGVQCAMCHSTAKPAQDDLLQVVPAGVVGPPPEGAPKSATGHNNTEYGTHLIDLCFHCHGTATTPVTDNPASTIPVGPSGFALTAKGLQPIANMFLNSPHAEYVGDSKKENIGAKTNYESSFEGYVCRTAQGKLSSTTYPNSGACTGAGYTWYMTTSNGNFCYYNEAQCLALPTGNWTTTFAASQYPWAADTGGPGGVCYGVGIGSIITTFYRNGVAGKIHNLDSTDNEACTNAGTGLADSGAAGFWVKDGETSPGGDPADTAQGNCMTCHDVHWALADDSPEAEPLRRECTTCHSDADPSASGAPHIDLATINHLGGEGTPLEDMALEPAEACIICHMPPSSEGASPMHLWRINTDPSYHTMGASKANTAPDGDYAEAAWVDIDHACGQCHGGSGAAKPNVPYFTTVQLAAVAEGMHGSSGQNYAVTFTDTADPDNPFEITVEAIVNCGGPCPTLSYDWDWGDGSPHGSGGTAMHTYGAPGTYKVALVVKSVGLVVGSSTRNLALTDVDLPPDVDGTCTWDDNTWTMELEDDSTDDQPGLSVVVDWGDGAKSSIAPGATVSKTYGIPGTFIVTQKAIDSKPQSSSRICGTATAVPFTISGTVYASDATTPLASAFVVLKKGSSTVAGTLTAPDGTYAFANLKPATYSLTAVRSGYTFPVPSLPSVTVGPDQAGQDITATSAAPRGARHSTRSKSPSSGGR